MHAAPRIAERAGVIGTLLGSFGCVACFPAVASIGAALGLGFLSRWEGVSVRYVVPLCALLVLVANLTGWLSHRRRGRVLVAAVGPLMALLGAFGLMGVFGLTRGFLPVALARGVFYAGLGVMIAVAILGMLRPPDPACRVAHRSGIRG